MKPVVPPQVPSVETLTVPVGDVALLDDDEGETEEGDLVETVEIELTLPVVEEQVPKAD